MSSTTVLMSQYAYVMLN